MTSILLTLIACDFSASSTVKTAEDTSATPADTATNEDTGSGNVDTGAPAHPSDVDDDGDGFTENDGDCNDEDAAIHPSVKEDSCDGVDNDCDDLTDEDAADDDSYEPNDDTDYELGVVNDDPLTAIGQLHNDQDVDRYMFIIPDSWWSSTEVDVMLTGIPLGSTYRLTIQDAQNDQEIYQDFGDTLLNTTISDSLWEWDVSGSFRAIVESVSGADCSASYTLIISKN